MRSKPVTPNNAIEEFQAHLQAALGSRLKELWLFGSRARGDHRLDSDYDFRVVADGDRTELRKLVAAAENEIMLKSGEIFASVVYTTDLWRQARYAPLGINVQREGRRIA